MGTRATRTHGLGNRPRQGAVYVLIPGHRTVPNARDRPQDREQYKRRVFGLVTRIVGTSDAEEVAQEVFVRIFRGLVKFRGDSALGTWIYRLSINAALTHVTRRQRHPEVGEEVLSHMPAPSRPQRDPCLTDRLSQAMSELPPGYRAILVLHDVEGLSHEECAAIMGCRVGTSKSQLHKARMRMRELLGPELAAERATRGRS